MTISENRNSNMSRANGALNKNSKETSIFKIQKKFTSSSHLQCKQYKHKV